MYLLELNKRVADESCVYLEKIDELMSFFV